MAIVIPAPKQQDWSIVPQMIGVGMNMGMQSRELRLKEQEAAKYDQTGAAYLNEDTAKTKENIFNNFRNGNEALGEAEAEEYIRRREVDKNLSPGARLEAIKTRKQVGLVAAQTNKLNQEAATEKVMGPWLQQFKMQQGMMQQNFLLGEAYLNAAKNPGTTAEARDSLLQASLLSQFMGLYGGDKTMALTATNKAFNPAFTKAKEDFATLTQKITDTTKMVNSGDVTPTALSYLNRLKLKTDPIEGVPTNPIDKEFADILSSAKSDNFLNDVETVKGSLKSGYNDTELLQEIQEGKFLSELVTDETKLRTMIESLKNAKTTELVNLRGLLNRIASKKFATGTQTPVYNASGPTIQNAQGNVKSSNPDDLSW